MRQRKKFYSVDANSILESVIALTIISICMFIAVLVYASVFSPKTSYKYYEKQNKMNEMFFLLQVREDSLNDHLNNELLIEGSNDNGATKYSIYYEDSLNITFSKIYYINAGK